MPEIETSVPPGLESYFDSLRVLWLDQAGMRKRFPVIELNWGKFDLWDHIYRSLLFNRLADIALEKSMTESQKWTFVEAYLDGIFTTVRSFLESLRVNVDPDLWLALSNGFALLKEDIYEALNLHPAGTATAQTLDKFRLKANWASEQ